MEQPQANHSRRFGAFCVLLGATLFGGTALVTLHDWLGAGDASLDKIAGGWLYDAVVLAAGIACLARAWIVPHERWGWSLLGAGILSWGAGEVYWNLYIVDSPAPPYPSPADALFIGLYPLAFLGLAGLVRARAKELDWRRWTDATIAALGTAALGAAFIFDFVADRTSGTAAQVATGLAYPIGDIVFLAAIVGVIALSGWRPGMTWSLLLAGLAAQAVADIAYTLQSTDGVMPAGNWVDPIYLISAAFLGSVLWLPKAAPIQPSGHEEGWRELIVPAFFATVMIGLFTMRYTASGSALSTALWALTMVAIVVRLALSVNQNRKLLEQVRTDSLTGLGNRGRMEADLEQRFAHASAEHPLMLYLFDLNGFKRYNDTFGHPEGDALLTRLGAALRDAVGNDGIAYRIGGDEFCVLFTCPPERLETALGAGAGALLAQDRGVEVSSSWGGARVPEEAATPSDALRLADVRMYAQKESRRTVPADALGASEPAEDQLEGLPHLRPG